MKTIGILAIQAFVLTLAELLYFKVARMFGIIDKPKRRSSHQLATLRGGGIIFPLSIFLYCAFNGINYPFFLVGLAFIAAVSFADDVKSLPISVRFIVHVLASAMLLSEAVEFSQNSMWFLPIGLVAVAVMLNAFNFMDGINGITGTYAMAVLIPLMYVNGSVHFVSQRLLITSMLSVIVFLYFNFRPIARCFAGDVGAMSMAFTLLFCIARLIAATGDFKYLLFIAVYCTDSLLTILHRLFLREDITRPHRKHAYQIMANELRIPHRAVAMLYSTVQLGVSFGLIFLSGRAWIYTLLCVAMLISSYAFFIRKFFPLHKQL